MKLAQCKIWHNHYGTNVFVRVGRYYIAYQPIRHIVAYLPWIGLVTL